MTFKQQVEATALDALIADLAREFLVTAKSKLAMSANNVTTPGRARANRARYEAIAEELRDVWRAARACDATATDLLRAFATKYKGLDATATHRMLLVANWKEPAGAKWYGVTYQGPVARVQRTFVDEDSFIHFLAANRAAVLNYSTPGGPEEERLAGRVALALGS